MKIFITGGSGFVGGETIRELSGQHDFVAMSRSIESDQTLRDIGAKPVRCDLDTVEKFHLKDIDIIIHFAAHMELWGPLSDFWQVNVNGTERLLQAAKKAGVKRFIHIGTEGSIFHGQHMNDVDEDSPLALTSPYPYCRTKAHGENLVRDYNAPDHGFETIILRPILIWGPRDRTMGPEIKKMIEQGHFMWIGTGSNLTQPTYIHNLTQAIELALSRGKSGGTYFIMDGPALSFRDFVERLMKSYNVVTPDKEVPVWLVRIAAYTLEFIWKLFKIKGEPPITRYVSNAMSRDCEVNSDKAMAELGYIPRYSLDQGMDNLTLYNIKQSD